MFTVVIPLYNKNNYITRAVSSVLTQTFLDFELIVVDDNSNDGSVERVLGINDNRLVLKVLKENRGVSYARNYGVKKAKYSYIAFLDADDEWLPNHLHVLNQLIKSYPQAKMFSSRHETINEQGKILIRKEVNYNYKSYCINNFLCMYKNDYSLINSSSACISKDFLLNEIGGFPEGKTNGEDIFVWIGSSLKSYVAFSVKKTVVIYRDAANRSINRQWNIPYYVEYYLPKVFNTEDRDLKSFIRKGVLTSFVSLLLNDNYSFNTAFKFIKFIYVYDKFNLIICLIIWTTPVSFLEIFRKLKTLFNKV